MMRSWITGAIILLTVILGNFEELTARTQSAGPPLSSGSDGLIIPPGHKFIMELETPIHTRTSKKGDSVEFVAAADILVDEQVVIPTGGGTNIIDAVWESVAYLERAAPERRHAVILLSDNQATVEPQASASGIIRRAMESETVIYSIKTAGRASPLAVPIPLVLTGEGSVGKITKETGGEIIDAKEVNALDMALASVIARLRMRYSMGYQPPETSQMGAYHSIEVRLTEKHGEPGKDYRVHARRGYYSTSAGFGD
jgi:VWFA-related protein